jgi:hypothetical protein
MPSNKFLSDAPLHRLEVSTWKNTVTRLKTARLFRAFEVHPITSHEGPDGEKTYSPTLSLTSVLDRGEW